MNAQVLSLLRDPDTHEKLEPRPDSLVNPRTGQVYPIRDGIPDFSETVTGVNQKYQHLYDRIAWLYDPALRLSRWLRPKEDFRKCYIDELEVPAHARVLEVSAGTGLNLPYLRSDIEFFGLDLSWGMLRQCRKNLRKWNRTAELFHGEAERLPFVDGAFDVVFHVGGINFFNDKKRAIREMIRVAKADTKIVVVDETEKVVKSMYERIPVVRYYYRERNAPVENPINWLPSDAREVQLKEFARGVLYCLTFRTPVAVQV